MKYNLTDINKRFNRGSNKWNELIEYGVGENDDIIPFSVADMEFQLAPEIKSNLIHQVENFVLGYENPTDEYLQSVVDWMDRRHNWKTEKEWIVPAHGVIEAFSTCIKVFSKENEGVMLLTPVYYPMYMAIDANNRKLVDCPLDYSNGKYSINFEIFEKLARDPNTKLFILCSPHNPSGRVWTKEELEKMTEICIENNVLVISDEIHNDLIMPGYKHTVYATISEEAKNKSIICTAPSKTFNLAGLQISNVFIPNKKYRDMYMNELKTLTANPKCNIIGYYACQTAYNESEKWLEEVLDVINTNKKLVEEFMKEEFPAIIVTPLEATYLMWMNFNGLGIDFKEMERINKEEAKLFFDEGYIFGKQGEGFERWNLACPTKYIKDGLARLKNTYSKYL